MLNAGLPQGDDDENDLDEEGGEARDEPTRRGPAPAEITE